MSKIDEMETGCFVCHGTGHWARECTSLPSIYLTDDAPKCYRCGGVGHFARFCPTSEKQFRHRERRASMPSIGTGYPEWSNYFGDLINFPVPQIPDQIFLIRPDYDNLSFENILDDEAMRSDCSCVDYIVEDAIENENNENNENDRDTDANNNYDSNNIHDNNLYDNNTINDNSNDNIAIENIQQ